MSPHPNSVVVVSPSGLVRELLASLLHTRGVQRVMGCATLQDGLLQASSASMLVCDASNLSSTEFENYRGLLTRQNPALRVLRLDESSGAAALATLLPPPASRRPDGHLPHDSLTALEGEVMLGVAAGLRNAEIARRMRRSAKTIEKHRASVLRKLGLRSVAQLTAYALRHRLIDGDSLLVPNRE